MPNTEREVPKTFLAALNHLGATFILMFSMTLELIVLVVIRIGNRIEGKPTVRTESASEHLKTATAASARRKSKSFKRENEPLDDGEFQRALAIAVALKVQSAPVGKQMAFDMPATQRETPVTPVPAQPPPPAPAPQPVRRPTAATEPEDVAHAAELVDEYIYEGTLSWAGHKWHPGNGKGYACFTVYLKLTSGDVKMLQATALKEALKSAEVNVDDSVTIKMSRECIGIVNGSKRHRNHCVVIKH